MGTKTAGKIYRLTPDELEILHRSIDENDPNIALGYFLMKPGQEIGFQLDENFVESGKWQKDALLAEQNLVCVVGGVATGKTIWAAVTFIYFALTTPDFKFMNVAAELRQASYAYEEIIQLSAETVFGKMIVSNRAMPVPYIEIKFYAGNQLMHGVFECASLGDTKSGQNILSYRGDIINIEEAFRLDNLSKVVALLQTRLTGSVSGRARIGRLQLISNPLDNPDGWAFFDLAASNPEVCFSRMVSTYHNKNVTDEQIKAMILLLPENERNRFITGSRVDTEGGFYSKTDVDAAESSAMDEIIIAGYENGEAGYKLKKLEYVGWTEFEMPWRQGHRYVIFGDPGTDAPPKRNAPVLQVWDITDFPGGPVIMVAYWWGSGFGKITPFTEELLRLTRKYAPEVVGIDSTATQKYLAELLSADRIEGKKLSIDHITPMDFSGAKKFSYLSGLRLMLEGGKMVWPKGVKGMRQIVSYDPARDQKGNSESGKIPQDNVATAAMAAFAIRVLYGIQGENDAPGGSENDNNRPASRHGRGQTGARKSRTSGYGRSSSSERPKIA